MSYYPPGHPYHRPEHDNTWWLNTSRGSNSSDSSSLGNTSSVGTLFSDSANSQDRNWKNGKVWTAVARDSNNGIRRGWSTSSSESCSSSRGGWINPCPSAEISSNSSGEDSRGASSRPSPGDQRPATRQSVQTDRVQRVANDIRAWGISTHNSLQSSGTKPAPASRLRPVDCSSLDTTRTAGQAARESPSIEASPVRPSSIQPSPQPCPACSLHSWQDSWSVWRISFPSSGSSGRIRLPSSSRCLWRISFPSSGSSGRIRLPSSSWCLWGSCLLPITGTSSINIPCSPWGLWGICLQSLGNPRRLSIPSSPEPGCGAQETERLLASADRSVEPRLTAPSQDQELRYQPAVELRLTAQPDIPHCSVVTPHYTALATALCLFLIVNANKFRNFTIGF